MDSGNNSIISSTSSVSSCRIYRTRVERRHDATVPVLQYTGQQLSKDSNGKNQINVVRTTSDAAVGGGGISSVLLHKYHILGSLRDEETHPPYRTTLGLKVPPRTALLQRRGSSNLHLGHLQKSQPRHKQPLPQPLEMIGLHLGVAGTTIGVAIGGSTFWPICS